MFDDYDGAPALQMLEPNDPIDLEGPLVESVAGGPLALDFRSRPEPVGGVLDAAEDATYCEAYKTVNYDGKAYRYIVFVFDDK